MGLTRDQKNRLSDLGRNMVVAIEQYKAEGFTFDAAIKCLRTITRIMNELMAFTQPYKDQINSMKLELNRTSKLKFCKRRRVKKDIATLSDIQGDISAALFTDELNEQIENIFKGSPVSSINAHENYQETQVMSGFGLFEPSLETRVYDYTVKFSDGAELVWHTLRPGFSLERARQNYESHFAFVNDPNMYTVAL